MTADVVAIQPGEGDRFDLGGGVGAILKIRGEHTGGAIAVVEHPFELGALVEPHIHTREDEYSYVLEGRMGFRAGDREVVLGPGGYIAKMRNRLHAMWNAGPEPARILEVISPAGFERFFEQLGRMVAAGDPGLAEVVRLAEDYGLSFDMGWVPDLVERYGLNPPPS